MSIEVPRTIMDLVQKTTNTPEYKHNLTVNGVLKLVDQIYADQKISVKDRSRIGPTRARVKEADTVGMCLENDGIRIKFEVSVNPDEKYLRSEPKALFSITGTTINNMSGESATEDDLKECEKMLYFFKASLSNQSAK
jgi:hypothetical protein